VRHLSWAKDGGRSLEALAVTMLIGFALILVGALLVARGIATGGEIGAWAGFYGAVALAWGCLHAANSFIEERFTSQRQIEHRGYPPIPKVLPPPPKPPPAPQRPERDLGRAIKPS
jgi:hypothetical protein